MMRVLAEKKIKIQNKADLTGNEASMGAEFPVKSALFCILIFFCARTLIIYVCGALGGEGAIIKADGLTRLVR